MAPFDITCAQPALRRGRPTKREKWIASVHGLSTHAQRVLIAARLAAEKENCECAECRAQKPLAGV